jgi:hypothetical protein
MPLPSKLVDLQFKQVFLALLSSTPQQQQQQQQQHRLMMLD